MPLKKYNQIQLREIERYVRERKFKAPNVDQEELRHEWIKENSQSFRDQYGTAQLI